MRRLEPLVNLLVEPSGWRQVLASLAVRLLGACVFLLLCALSVNVTEAFPGADILPVACLAGALACLGIPQLACFLIGAVICLSLLYGPIGAWHLYGWLGVAVYVGLVAFMAVAWREGQHRSTSPS